MKLHQFLIRPFETLNYQVSSQIVLLLLIQTEQKVMTKRDKIKSVNL